MVDRLTCVVMMQSLVRSENCCHKSLLAFDNRQEPEHEHHIFASRASARICYRLAFKRKQVLAYSLHYHEATQVFKLPMANYMSD